MNGPAVQGGFDLLSHDPEAVEQAVTFLKALSHVGRLQILCQLLDRDCNVGELTAVLGEPQAAVSQQLMRLRAEGFVKPRRSGKQVVYQLARPEIAPVVGALREAFCGSEKQADR